MTGRPFGFAFLAPVSLAPVALALASLAACGHGARPPLPPLPVGAQVAPCPDSPNCVSTAVGPEDTEHHAAPLAFTGPLPAARDAMKALVLALPRTALVSETPTSLHFTFTSELMRFVDDVDLVFLESERVAGEGVEGGRIEYRSASRVGHGDMGVNRARMDDIAARWAAAPSPR